MAAEKAEIDALKKECDGLRAQIEVSNIACRSNTESASGSNRCISHVSSQGYHFK